MASSKLLTVLELRDLLNNIILPLTLDVDEVFFIYHHTIKKEIIDNIRKIILRHKIIKLNFKSIIYDDEEIDDILNKNPDIIVDIGGEKYLSLVLFDKVLNKNNLIVYYDNEENKIKTYRKMKR